MAFPGHLRRGCGAVRDHPDLREAPEQGRDGGERHGSESRTVSVTELVWRRLTERE